MRELRMLGSVRGALSNGRPYRDRGGDGREHWTLRMLGAKAVELGFVQSCSRAVVQSRDDPPAFEKSQLKPWQKQEWCIPEVGEEFVAAMEEVIELYTAPHALDHPVICFDESPIQLLRHVADPLPASPGEARRLARKFNFVHTPKHGSWLNIAEISLPERGQAVEHVLHAGPGIVPIEFG